MTQWSRTSVLVTGGAGVVGSQVVGRLSNLGARVVVLDDLSSGHRWALADRCCDVIVGDVTDPAALQEAFSRRPEVVFHLAALFANQNSVDHPERDLEVNGLGTWRVFEAARRQRVRRVVYTSSSCVYGDTSGPVREEQVVLEARTPYQATKLLGEEYAHLLGRTGVETVITRLFNVYGPGDVPGPYRGVVPNFGAAALRGQPISLHDDGRATRDFTHVGDVVEGLLRAATVADAVGGTFNLGTGTETRIADLARAILAATGSASPLTPRPRRPWDDVQRRCADVHSAKRVLGWRATCSLDVGLAATMRWLARHLRLPDGLGAE